MDTNKLIDNSSKKITISVEQRNGKKNITHIIGLSKELDLNKILPYLKKKYNCNGHIADDENFGKIISLSGNQKNNVFNFIIENDIEKPENIIIKGV